MGNHVLKKLSKPPLGFLISIAANIIANIVAVWLPQLSITLILLVISICLWVYFFLDVVKTTRQNDNRGWLQVVILFLAFIPLNLLVFTVLLVNIDIEKFTNTIAPPKYLKFPSDSAALDIPNGFESKIQNGRTEIIMNYKSNSGKPYCKVNMPLNYNDVREITLQLDNIRKSDGSIKVESGSYTFKSRDPSDQNSNLPVGYVRLRNGEIPFILILPEGTLKNINLPNITFTFEDVQNMMNLSIKVALKKPRLFGDASRFLFVQAILVLLILILLSIAFYKEKIRISFARRNPKQRRENSHENES